MWQRLGSIVLKYRLLLLIILFVSTGLMGYFASKVKLSYEFARAIPTNNPKYKEYVAFKEKFGDDGNVLVIGIQTDKLFILNIFKAYTQLHQQLKAVSNVEDVISIPTAVNLQKDAVTEKLLPVKIFADSISTQQQLDAAKEIFYSLPFYKSLQYNDDEKAYLIGVRINKDSLNSPIRSKIVADINTAVQTFETNTAIETHVSGLPLIRTVVGDKLQKEMRFFLLVSLALSALILLLFFRSISTTILSLLVVIAGVIWSVGLLYLFGYKINLLTALIPPLIVVIGIPNCIYFINKFHTSFVHEKDIANRKSKALLNMVSKMGVVTLFCNITAAIGFAVFALTKSAILKEFGIIAGISIMLIFFISFILLPTVLSYLPAPKPRQLKYLKNKLLTNFLLRIEKWVFGHKKLIYFVTTLIIIVAVVGIFKLKTVAYIVDDLPKTDKIYTDLKFFEKNFKGVMPLEIVIDTKKRRGLTLDVFEKINVLSQYIASQKEMNRPLSVAEGLKFAKQGFYEGDSANYLLPNNFDGAFVAPYLRPDRNDSGPKNNFTKMLMSFMDSARQTTRISLSMADVGTAKLPAILDSIQKKANQLFDTAQYKVSLTGTSITFLEGSKFIINGLKESIFWAFLLISLCMLYLFKSVRILLCSLIPNLVPLVIIAGVMGWSGVPLKPSTVLVFSVALGIAIDITIRFLVNYKQELPIHNNNVPQTVGATIKHTGVSIIYTSLVLVAGFVIFCGSSFGGTIALGWLTSLTLLVATITNLVLLPVLLLSSKKKK